MDSVVKLIHIILTVGQKNLVFIEKVLSTGLSLVLSGTRKDQTSYRSNTFCHSRTRLIKIAIHKVNVLQGRICGFICIEISVFLYQRMPYFRLFDENILLAKKKKMPSSALQQGIDYLSACIENQHSIFFKTQARIHTLKYVTKVTFHLNLD